MKKLMKNIFGIYGINNKRSLIQEEQESLKNLLPKDYAQKILDLEIQVELYDIDFEKITELLNLYTTIIDYYINIENDNYIFFKNKMKEMILKPKVIYIMNKKYKINTNEKNIDQKHLTNQQVKIKEFDLKVKNKNNDDIDDKYINDIMNLIDENVEKTKNLIKKDIISQKINLNKRLEKRKFNISQKKSFSRDILSIKYNENSINDINEDITENIILEEEDN